MSRREFPKSVRVDRLRHCKMQCEGCGKPLTVGKFDFHHERPDGLLGEPTFDNCRVLCSGSGSCHAEQTKLDRERIDKAKAQEAAYLGIKNPPKKEIKSRGFPKREKPEPKPLPPRQGGIAARYKDQL